MPTPRPRDSERPDDPADFVEDVQALVERIPIGRVMSYGAVADAVGRGGPRQVGAVMSRYGAAVPWHRVVTASGRTRSEEHTSELQSRVDISYAVFCLKKKKPTHQRESAHEKLTTTITRLSRSRR